MLPLPVRPITEGGKLVGCRHVRMEHIEKNKWMADLTSKPGMVSLVERAIRLQPVAAARDVFDRDGCGPLDNILECVILTRRSW
jgi:hypothetical protein